MNGIKLFRVFGITVFLHWSWLVVAAIQIQYRSSGYHSLIWPILEYLVLFLIVLMHEFGHALACRSVGGTADRIMLWPLGGIAYVSPPPRPGAVLWSIAAGPLVNVALLFVTIPLCFLHLHGDVRHLTFEIAYINAGLLIFNMLPIYPLDGGQILQSLLWFGMGQGRSLAVATVIGMIGSAALGLLALYMQSIWIGFMAFFVASRCWSGWKMGVMIRERENARPRPGFACPACGKPPMTGNFWKCPQCQTSFDLFATGAMCPSCDKAFPTATCSNCRTRSASALWQQAPAYVAASPTAPPPLVGGSVIIQPSDLPKMF